MSGLLLNLDGIEPELAGSSWVAPSAILVGAVTLEESSSVWYGAVLRGDGARIVVQGRTNLQDGVVVHGDPGYPVHIGPRVSVGHRAVLHGCTIENETLIGIGAVVLNGAHLGKGCLIAAGTVILEGAQVPPHSLVAGVPGRVRRSLGDDERADIVANAERYVALAARHKAAIERGRPLP